MTSKAAQTKTDKHELAVVEAMQDARRVAVDVLGANATTDAVHEIYDYLEVADEDLFVADLKRVVEHAKKIYETTAPTTEQVFGLFERIFGEDE